MYSYSSWKNYWEGTLKRENLNLGTVSTQMYGVMGNYGITRKLNLLFGVPYVKTKASAGTLAWNGRHPGSQPVCEMEAIAKKNGRWKTFLFGIAGVSFPLTNYSRFSTLVNWLAQ